MINKLRKARSHLYRGRFHKSILILHLACYAMCVACDALMLYVSRMVMPTYIEKKIEKVGSEYRTKQYLACPTEFELSEFPD